MSNPFEDLFTHDPAAQERQRAHQQQQAEIERKRLFYQTLETELQRYDALVMEVLEQLRDAVYPTYEVRRATPPSQSPSYSVFDNSVCWSVGFRYIRSTGVKSLTNTEYFNHIVAIGLDLTEHGEARAFKGMYLGSHEYSDGYRYKKEQASALDRAALIQMLTELHKPSHRAEVVLAHHMQITTALQRLKALPSFQAYYSDLRSPDIFSEWLEPVVADPFLEPPMMPNRSGFGPWVLGYENSDDYGNVGPPFERVTINLLTTEDGVPTQYECVIKDLDGAQLVPLGEKALSAALERALEHIIKLANEKKATQAQKKGWFGR